MLVNDLYILFLLSNDYIFSNMQLATMTNHISGKGYKKKKTQFESQEISKGGMLFNPCFKIFLGGKCSKDSNFQYEVIGGLIPQQQFEVPYQHQAGEAKAHFHHNFLFKTKKIRSVFFLGGGEANLKITIFICILYRL